jgi:hypothetical protein
MCGAPIRVIFAAGGGIGILRLRKQLITGAKLSEPISHKRSLNNPFPQSNNGETPCCPTLDSCPIPITLPAQLDH